MILNEKQHAKLFFDLAGSSIVYKGKGLDFYPIEFHSQRRDLANYDITMGFRQL